MGGVTENRGGDTTVRTALMLSTEKDMQKEKFQFLI